MRDPLAPIPSPAASPSFWHSADVPRTTRVGGDRLVDEFSPLRLLQRDQGDTHGLDRRSRRRDMPEETAADEPEHGTARLLSTLHVSRRHVLGLCSAHGWALVHTVSIAPTGVLLHLLDLMNLDLDPALRRGGRALLARLAPLLGAPLRPSSVHEPGSPLATVGGCLLAPRVVADLSNWASYPLTARSSSRGGLDAFTVTLLVPGATPRSTEGLTRVEGELVPMTDPQPRVLAVALSPPALASLERAL